MEKDEDAKRIKEEYEKGVDQDKWRQKLMDEQKQREELRAREAADRVQLEREIKRTREMESKTNDEERRLLEKKLEIEKMKRELMRQKQELMGNVNYAQEQMSKGVRSDIFMGAYNN